MSAVDKKGFHGLKSWTYPRSFPVGSFDCLCGAIQNPKIITRRGRQDPKMSVVAWTKVGPLKPQDADSGIDQNLNRKKAEGTPTFEGIVQGFEGFQSSSSPVSVAIPRRDLAGSEGSHGQAACSTSPPWGFPCAPVRKVVT